MDKPVIAFDLDEVLCELAPATHAALLAAVPDYPPPEKWFDYFHYEKYGLSLAQFLEILVEEQVLENSRPAPYAAEVLRAMREKGYRTAVVTARGYHHRGEEVTREWFETYGLEVDELRIVQMLESKVDAIRSLGHVQAYVDDLPAHLNRLAAAKVGGALYLMRKPWNAEVFGYRVVRDLVDYCASVAHVLVLTKNKNKKEQAHVGGTGGKGPGR